MLQEGKSSNGSEQARQAGQPGSAPAPSRQAGGNTAAGATPAHGEAINARRQQLAAFIKAFGEHLDGNGATQRSIATDHAARPNDAGDGQAPPAMTPANEAAPQSAPDPQAQVPPAVGPDPAELNDLPPRVRQTLDRLLAGDSEKQAARALGISPHTVHVYVKQLYRHFDVSSRGELLALWVRA